MSLETLKGIFELIGSLDDKPGEDTPRERFRRYIRNNIIEIGQIRDYVEESLRNPGELTDLAFGNLGPPSGQCGSTQGDTGNRPRRICPEDSSRRATPTQ